MTKYIVVKEEHKISWYEFNTETLHRLDGPAVEYADGGKAWLQNGKYHREDGPAVEYCDGHKAWYQNGLLHREDGPAVEYADGHKEWWQNDNLHREDGPAVEHADGKKYWFINGKKLLEAEFLSQTKSTFHVGAIISIEIDGKKHKVKVIE